MKISRKKIRKITAIVVVFLLIISFIPFSSLRVYAEEPNNNEIEENDKMDNETEIDEADIIESIDNVSNLHWIENSSATISWTGVDEANYYAVTISVYQPDGTTLIGTSYTGTTSLELDVQQEIHTVIGNLDCELVNIKATVYSQKKQDDEVVIQSDGVTTDLWEYRLIAVSQIPTPSNVRITDDYFAEFNYDIDNPEENIDRVFFEIHLGSSGSAIAYASTITWENGLCRADLNQAIFELYQNYGNSGEIDVYYRVSLEAKGDRYSDSDFSDFSNSIKYDGGLVQISAPTNVRLTDDYYAEFNYDIDNPEENIDRVFFYIYFGSSGRAITYASSITWENGLCRADLNQAIFDLYQNDGITGEIDVSYRVSLEAKGDRYSDSDFSDLSNTVKYVKQMTQISTPTNVRLTDNYYAEFNYDIDNPEENIDRVFFLIYLGASGSAITYASSITWENGLCRADLNQAIFYLYQRYGNTGEIDVSYKVSLEAKGDRYSDSNYSEISNIVRFSGFKEIEAVTLSPATPIICQGRSYYLGKTITPEDAYYEDIDWSSEDDSIVIVDEDGQITGVTPGTVNVTAAIGDVTATVPVTVYAISSNIDDPNDNEEVTNTAGEIIDDIVNNENPSLDDTDIDPENIEEIKEEIHEAIENGDTFHTDVIAIQQYYEKYKMNWGQIQKATRYLNAQFEGAYNIEVEMYHKDHDNNNHHIGNITELDNEISFTFDLPTGMKEQQSGNTKKYVLVRVHKNSEGTMEYSPVNYVINGDGTFTAQSDQYSDFVWCSVSDEMDVELNLTQVSTGVKLSWDALEGAVKYRVYRQKEDGSWLRLKETKKCEFIDEAVEDNTEYIYAVVGYDADAKAMSTLKECGRIVYTEKIPKVEMEQIATGIKLTWDALEGAIKYRVYRQKEDGCWSRLKETKKCEFIDETVKDNTEYVYAVVGYTADVKPISTLKECGRIVYIEKIPKVEMEQTAIGIKLTWDALEEAAKYRVYRQNEDGSWSRLKETKKCEFIDKTVENNTEYIYAVVGYDENVKAVNTFKECGRIVYIEKIPKVELEQTATGIKLTWDSLDGAIKYRVYRQKEDGSWSRLKETKKTEFIDAAVEDNTEYIYAVVGYDENVKAMSNLKEGGSIIYVENIPDLQIEKSGMGLKLTWTTLEGAAKYRVYKLDNGGNWKRITITKGNSFWDSDVEDQINYTYSIVGYDQSNQPMSKVKECGNCIYVENIPDLQIEQTDKGIKLSWELQSDVSEYAIFRKETGEDWSRITIIDGCEFLDESVENQKEYIYGIRCMDSFGEYLNRLIDGTTITADIPEFVIKNQPQNSVCIENHETTFEVTAGLQYDSGAFKVVENIDYQWQVFKNNQWTDIEGANSSKYILTPTVGFDGNKYRVSVSFNGNAIISNVATLTVNKELIIKDDFPETVNVREGEYFNLSASLNDIDTAGVNDMPIARLVEVDSDGNEKILQSSYVSRYFSYDLKATKEGVGYYCRLSWHGQTVSTRTTQIYVSVPEDKPTSVLLGAGVTDFYIGAGMYTAILYLYPDIEGLQDYENAYMVVEESRDGEHWVGCLREAYDVSNYDDIYYERSVYDELRIDMAMRETGSTYFRIVVNGVTSNVIEATLEDLGEGPDGPYDVCEYCGCIDGMHSVDCPRYYDEP